MSGRPSDEMKKVTREPCFDADLHWLPQKSANLGPRAAGAGGGACDNRSARRSAGQGCIDPSAGGMRGRGR